MMSFELENISKSYGAVRALDGISFSTGAGEIFGIIGPDGAGKTTLFRILATLILADKGIARVGGMDVRKDFREVRKQIGYMPGRFSLYHDLTVEENLRFYATVFGTNINEHFSLVRRIYDHIAPFRNRRAGNLSGGMKQKLALSCALIHRPSCLVLDEPTTGVDAVSRKEFWELLGEIQREGITILVSTPYMDEASLCNRVGLMQNGRLLSVSDPAALSLRDGTRLFIFRTSGDIYGALQRIRNLNLKLSAWLFGDEIHVLVPGHIQPEGIEGPILSWGMPDAFWREAKPGVEDCFLQLMSEEKDSRKPENIEG